MTQYVAIDTGTPPVDESGRPWWATAPRARWGEAVAQQEQRLRTSRGAALVSSTQAGDAAERQPKGRR
jgi:hypothetical protein